MVHGDDGLGPEPIPLNSRLWCFFLFPLITMSFNIDVGVEINVGLGELCLKLPVLCYASNSWKYILPEEAALCSHSAQLCNGTIPLTQGLGQATCCKLADYGCMQL